METTNYDNRNFMIFNVSELANIDFTKVLESSSTTVRKSVNQEKTFVKWDGTMPECVANLTTKEGPYTYDEVMIILNTSEWTAPFPMA